jgi:hypothetical protein
MSPPSSTVDPRITRLLDAIGNGATASDSVGAPASHHLDTGARLSSL